MREVKALLEIDPENTSQDKLLTFFAEYATSWIEEWCGRDFSYKARTQYYDGTGTPFINLRNRPVMPSPTPAVRVDAAGAFGAASGAFDSTTALVYGEDFTVRWDQDDGSSRSGTLIRLRGVWDRTYQRSPGWLAPYATGGQGTVKVTYTAGYTTDTLPASLRYGCNLLVAKMRTVWPLGMEVGSESYEERSVSYLAEKKGYLMSLAAPHLFGFRNWKW